MRHRHLLSIDCEEYFHPGAAPVEWDRYPQRIDYSTRVLLDMLDEFQATATFFIVGWVAEHNPGLVATIVQRGHNVACHSYWHRLVYTLSIEDFRADTRRARNAIEQAAGCPVTGYRAPSFSITPTSSWALDVLSEEGFQYDSSVFPVLHDIYGWPGAQRTIHSLKTGSGVLWEFPPATFQILNRMAFPVAGGGYLRMLPMWFTRFGLHRAAHEEKPFLIYVHPWELDTGQPRLKAGFRFHLRHYTGLGSMRKKVRELLGRYTFTSIECYLVECEKAVPLVSERII